jgi:hypothetical protein
MAQLRQSAHIADARRFQLYTRPPMKHTHSSLNLDRTARLETKGTFIDDAAFDE